jgi:protein-disulfide isomerase
MSTPTTQARKSKSASRADHVSRRAERRLQEHRAARQRRLMFFGGAVAIAIVVAAILILVNRDDGDSSFPTVVAAAATDGNIPFDGTTLGDPNAPVTVVEYGDYQCPGCAQFATNDQQKLINDYVATGKVKFVFHAFPFLDRTLSLNANGTVSSSGDGESIRAAEASLCAVDQNAFWRYHDTIYVNHSGENQGAYSESRLLDMADVIGLDRAAFATCLDSGTHKTEVQTLYADSIQAGVMQTPSFAINGKVSVYNGYNDLKTKIDAALAG